MKISNSVFRIAAFGFALAALIGLGLAPATSSASPTPTAGAPSTGSHKAGMHATAMTHAKGVLDGKHFDGTTGLDGKTDGSKEEVSFRNGMFKSSYCLAQGFKLAPYSAETKDGISTFKSEQVDPAKGTLVWEGTITGHNLTANGTLTAPGKDPAKFWIKASLKTSEHAATTPSGKK